MPKLFDKSSSQYFREDEITKEQMFFNIYYADPDDRMIIDKHYMVVEHLDRREPVVVGPTPEWLLAWAGREKI